MEMRGKTKGGIRLDELYEKVEPGFYVLKGGKDCVRWIRRDGFDFGWWDEVTYYKYPLPNFETLFEIVIKYDFH
jgi:hypothetical protein